ncbi:MAG: SDR family NAD(P)-dependent oxidoreductase, partial [Gammaproteobacteria bacterium]|nr:SDR family NAD(P)-dependent oxidoreductase [Gammaproteobacteria bacterium]
MVEAASPVPVVNLQGKRVLITQADEFMGPALCEVFASAGAEVIADTSSLVEPGAPAELIAGAGRIDVLVANLALAAPATRVNDVTDAEWRDVFAQLVDPLPRLVRAVLPQMIERRAGKVLVMGSAAALR